MYVHAFGVQSWLYLYVIWVLFLDTNLELLTACSPSLSIDAASISITPRAVQVGKSVNITCASSLPVSSIRRVELRKMVDNREASLAELAVSSGQQNLYISDGAVLRGSQVVRIEGELGVELMIAASDWSDATTYLCFFFRSGVYDPLPVSDILNVYGKHLLFICICLRQAFALSLLSLSSLSLSLLERCKEM